MLVSTIAPDSTLKKKFGPLAYHLIRERADMEDWRTEYINYHDNEAYLLTKVLPFGEKKRKCFREALTHIYGSP